MFYEIYIFKADFDSVVDLRIKVTALHARFLAPVGLNR